MTTVHVDLREETHSGLKAAADQRGLTVAELLREISEAAVANIQAKARFEEMAARGNPKRALEILDELDRLDAKS
jgi:hypothetical protein